MNIINDTILVTGGTGLLGSHLILRLLSGGGKIRATFRKNSNRDLVSKVAGYYGNEAVELCESIDWVDCTLSDYERVSAAMKAVGKVYHCAAIVSFEKGEDKLIIENNFNATSNIVNACLENKVEKLCHVSSVASLGASDGQLMVNEASEWNNGIYQSAYSISKHLSEMEVWKGIKRGLNAVIVNPSIILGPGDWTRSSAAIFKSVDDGLNFFTDGIKGYVDVDDVSRAMILLMDSDIKGERFILNSENLSNKQLFSLITQSLGISKRLVRVPRIISPLIMPAARILEFFTGKKLPLTKDLLRSAWTKVGYDNRKIISRTGMNFLTVAESVRRITSIYRSDMVRSATNLKKSINR